MDNPFAFSGNAWTPDNQDVHEGMTLRDYFAAAALQGIMLLAEVHKEDTDKKVAEWAYSYADAMLKERNRE